MDQINDTEFQRGMTAGRNYLRVSDTTHNMIVQRYHEADSGSFEAMQSGDYDRFSYLLGMASVLGDVVDA